MKNTKLFQYVVIGAFIFFIIVGAIMFATFRANDSTQTTINITVWGTLPNDAFTSFVGKYFNALNLKHTVMYKQLKPATFSQELVEALASGTGPDAIVLPDDLIVHFTNKIYPIPYSVLPELTYKQTFIQEGDLYLNDTGILALPFAIDPLVMYWNKDIFNNAFVTKPPTTWLEISNLVPKMTKKDQAQNITRSTVALGEFRNIFNAKEIFSSLLIQSGNPIVGINTDGTLKSTLQDTFDLNTSPAILSLEFYTNFSNPVKRDYSWNRSLTNSLDMFTNGDLAIYFGFASEFMNIKAKNPNLNFDVALLPQISGGKVNSTFGHLIGFAIMKNSTNPAGTFTILSTLTSAEAFPYWKDIFNLPSARRDILSQVDKSAAKTVFNNSAIMSKGWLDPNSKATSAIFQEMVESYTTGRENINNAIGNASDQIENLLNIK